MEATRLCFTEQSASTAPPGGRPGSERDDGHHRMGRVASERGAWGGGREPAAPQRTSKSRTSRSTPISPSVSGAGSVGVAPETSTT